MRLIKVSAPRGADASVIETAFGVGISDVSLQTSTPKEKRFIDALLNFGSALVSRPDFRRPSATAKLRSIRFRFR